jgi:hypothetical protein
MYCKAILASLLLSALPADATEPELAARITSLAATSSIEVSMDSSDSFTYLIVHRSGKLTHVRWRTQSASVRAPSQTTRYAVIDFAAVYQQITQAVVVDKTSSDDHLVYFWTRNSASSTAVFIPAAQTVIVRHLLDAFRAAEISEPDAPSDSGRTPEVTAW